MLNPRQRRILEFLHQHGDASVQDLSRSLRVTTQTIRRDVRALEEEKLVARFHGGVGLPSSVENIDYDRRQVMNANAKREIARLVAGQVEPGRSLIINIGTTTEEVARALAHHRGIRVVTNNLNVATILAPNEQSEVFIAGGLVRHADYGIVGEATLDFIRQFRVDIGVIGVSSIEADGALLDYDYREVRVAQAIVEQSREVWLVADHSKFTRSALVRLGHIAEIDRFFTDLPVPEGVRKALEEAQVQVHVVQADAAPPEAVHAQSTVER